MEKKAIGFWTRYLSLNTNFFFNLILFQTSTSEFRNLSKEEQVRIYTGIMDNLYPSAGKIFFVVILFYLNT